MGNPRTPSMLAALSENRWALSLVGVLSVIFGIILAVLPGVRLLSVVWLVGLYALAAGVALTVLALRVRWFQRREG